MITFRLIVLTANFAKLTVEQHLHHLRSTLSRLQMIIFEI